MLLSFRPEKSEGFWQVPRPLSSLSSSPSPSPLFYGDALRRPRSILNNRWDISFNNLLQCIFVATLQRKNTEISKQIFPEKEYRGLSPNFYIHVSVSNIYLPTIGLPIFCWRKYVDRSWDYINRSQTHECWNWGWGRAIPRKGIHKWDFRCSVKDSDKFHVGSYKRISHQNWDLRRYEAAATNSNLSNLQW